VIGPVSVVPALRSRRKRARSSIQRKSKLYLTGAGRSSLVGQELRGHAHAISGNTIGKEKWNRKFENRHPSPRLCTARPAKLDPKRAKNSEALHLDFDGIPPEHLWTEDEKGVQIDGHGGRRIVLLLQGPEEPLSSTRYKQPFFSKARDASPAVLARYTLFSIQFLS
jgi:hypothetical protein